MDWLFVNMTSAESGRTAIYGCLRRMHFQTTNKLLCLTFHEPTYIPHVVPVGWMKLVPSLPKFRTFSNAM